jgi:hypothetical protein
LVSFLTQIKRIELTPAYTIAASRAFVGIFYHQALAVFSICQSQDPVTARFQTTPASGAIAVNDPDDLGSPLRVTQNAANEPKQNHDSHYNVNALHLLQVF